MTVKQFWVLLSVKDLPEPYVPSEKVKCVLCGEELWLCLHCKAQHPRRNAICKKCAQKLEEGKLKVS